ncbi:MAG: IclR family transcriptional regulator [Burkholderiaceae bacterium]|nr:IclR family transcriptional regulator [Burkholderiaceae bacterium]
MDTTPVTPGTQALRRGLELLRLLGQHQQDGVRMSDVMNLTGLERSTAHRLLSCLVDEEFAEKDETSKRYRLGINAMHLGSAVVRKMPLVNRFRPLMQRLARMSGDTVFLVVRDGDEVVCLHREEGPLPVKVFTIDVGRRRLLGIGAGGLALLARLPDDEIEDIFVRNQATYEEAGFNRFSLMRAVREVRSAGYAVIVETISTGVVGLGACLPESLRVQAALSLGTTTMRFTRERHLEFKTLLLDAVQGIKSHSAS